MRFVAIMKNILRVKINEHDTLIRRHCLNHNIWSVTGSQHFNYMKFLSLKYI